MMGIFTGCTKFPIQKVHIICIKAASSKPGAVLIVACLTITVFSTARLHEVGEVRLPHSINTVVEILCYIFNFADLLACGVGKGINKQV